MARMVFEWDDASDPAGNVPHLARPDIPPAQAEKVVRNRNNELIRSDSSTYPIRFGRTGSGKYIAVVFYAVGENPELVRVITAYPVPKPRRRR